MDYDFGLTEDETDEKLALTNKEIEALDVALSLAMSRMIEEKDDEYARLIGGLQSRVHNRDFVDDTEFGQSSIRSFREQVEEMQKKHRKNSLWDDHK